MKTYALFVVVFFTTVFFQEYPSNSIPKPLGRPVNNRLIIDLNLLTYVLAEQHDHFYSFIGIRTLTMVHLAIHDLLNIHEPQFKTYLDMPTKNRFDPLTAAVASTRTILEETYPNRKDTIQAACDQWMEKTAKGSFQKNGEEVGIKVAKAYLALRKNDGHQKEGDYTPMTKPGDYQYTPGWDNWVLKPDFQYAQPFALDTVTQFRSPPPPALNSELYTQSFDEVKLYGRKKSKVRSDDQTSYAYWWAEFAEHGWNRLARITAEERQLSLHETARLFALLNMDIYDIYLASLESKYSYDTWRPYTAIRKASFDNNPQTEADPDWEPEMLTPPWPEYPSAHAAVAAGGAEIVSHVYGTDHVPFSMVSTSGLPGSERRFYTNIQKAADECADSRIMNGYHFRFATEEGKNQGRTVAKYILQHFLRPL